MGRKKKEIQTTRLIEEEYLQHNDEETDEIYWMKEALKNALTPYQRKIYITYLENETYTATAKVFKVSTPTCQKYITGLTQKIIDFVNEKMR